MTDILLLVGLLLQLFPNPGNVAPFDHAPGCIGTFDWPKSYDPRPYCLLKESEDKFWNDMWSKAVRDAEIERAAVMRAREAGRSMLRYSPSGAPIYATSLAEVMAELRSVPSPPADPPPVASPPVDPSRCGETVYPGERWEDAFNRIKACQQ